MKYNELTKDQKERLHYVFGMYGEIPEDATHIDMDYSMHTASAVVLRYIDNVEYHLFPCEDYWHETGEKKWYAKTTFQIPDDFCRETGRLPEEEEKAITKQQISDIDKQIEELQNKKKEIMEKTL